MFVSNRGTELLSRKEVKHAERSFFSQYNRNLYNNRPAVAPPSPFIPTMNPYLVQSRMPGALPMDVAGAPLAPYAFPAAPAPAFRPAPYGYLNPGPQPLYRPPMMPVAGAPMAAPVVPAGMAAPLVAPPVAAPYAPAGMAAPLMAPPVAAPYVPAGMAAPLVAAPPVPVVPSVARTYMPATTYAAPVTAYPAVTSYAPATSVVRAAPAVIPTYASPTGGVHFKSYEEAYDYAMGGRRPASQGPTFVRGYDHGAPYHAPSYRAPAYHGRDEVIDVQYRNLPSDHHYPPTSYARSYHRGDEVIDVHYR